MEVAANISSQPHLIQKTRNQRPARAHASQAGQQCNLAHLARPGRGLKETQPAPANNRSVALDDIELVVAAGVVFAE